MSHIPSVAGFLETLFAGGYSHFEMNRHQLIDDRSIALGRAVAARLAAEPQLLNRARATIERWLQTSSPGVRLALEEWRMALDGPIDGVIALLSESDERSVRLRQSNPFAGVLSHAERNAILRQFGSHDAATA